MACAVNLVDWLISNFVLTKFKDYEIGMAEPILGHQSI